MVRAPPFLLIKIQGQASDCVRTPYFGPTTPAGWMVKIYDRASALTGSPRATKGDPPLILRPAQGKLRVPVLSCGGQGERELPPLYSELSHEFADGI